MYHKKTAQKAAKKRKRKKRKKYGREAMDDMGRKNPNKKL
jgi:hypothetical protein